ncbi:MAG: helix-turn-helix domain-containing protein [Planctomycetes bacterium]|nr:helix-turn-helix domain-containing protein [Planctomycetota bacterium]
MIAVNEHDDGPEGHPKLLNVAALAVILSVSVRQAHRMNRAGLIPAPLKIGACVRWHPDEIDRWLQSGAPVRSEWEKRATQTVGNENA